VASLPSETLYFRHGDALNAYVRERSAHVVHFEGFDYRCDEFHKGVPEN